MSHRLRLFVYVDALGWEIARELGAFPWLDAHRQPVASQLGYSCACVPTILTGASPAEHGHWNVFYRPAERTTFRGYRWLRHLPGLLRVPGRLQPWVNRALAARHGLSGYVSIYRLPLQRWHEFELCEHRDLFAPGAFPRTGSVIDDALASGQHVHVSDWRRPEAARWADLTRALQGRRPLDWAFLYLADLDGVLHRHGWPAEEPRALVRTYERRLAALLALARSLGYRVETALVSDHGMTNLRRSLDVRAAVRRAVPAREGRDYQVIYDSTMARYWSEDPALLARIGAALGDQRGVQVLAPEDLRRLGAWFPGGEYGQLIALAEPGVQVAPSDMGRRALAGMHGYHPDHAGSAAVLLCDYRPDTAVTHLRDLRALLGATLASSGAAA